MKMKAGINYSKGGYQLFNQSKPRKVVRMDWGNVPAWLALLGGLVAVLTYWTSRRETSRYHAARVYTIVESPDYSPGPRESPHGPTHVWVTNGSTLPIFNVTVAPFEWGRRRYFTWWFRKVEEYWSKQRVNGQYRNFLMIAPGATTPKLKFDGPTTPLPRKGSFLPPVIVHSQDGNGRRWVRWPNGRLSRRRLWTRWSAPIRNTPASNAEGLGVRR
jgi:hypothetical protein